MPETTTLIADTVAEPDNNPSNLLSNQTDTSEIMSKITDLISAPKAISFSYEAPPDIKEEDIKLLVSKPLFFAVTWHAQPQDFDNFDIAPLKLATLLRNTGNNVLLHVSCSNMKKKYLSDLLKFLQDKDICNIFIILGQKYDPATSDFETSQALVTYVRKLTGSYFCIGVAGFPGQDEKLLQLKEKIKYGVDFILTQAFFERTVFEDFVQKCKQLDINIPILPGIFPFQTKRELEGFVNLCKIHVSHNVLEKLKDHSGNEIIANLIVELTKSSDTKHFHLFKLNKLQIASNLVKGVSSLIEDQK